MDKVAAEWTEHGEDMTERAKEPIEALGSVFKGPESVAEDANAWAKDAIQGMTLISMFSAMLQAYRVVTTGGEDLSSVLAVSSLTVLPIVNWVRNYRQSKVKTLPEADDEKGKLVLALKMFDYDGLKRAFFSSWAQKGVDAARTKISDDPPPQKGGEATYYLSVVPTYAVSYYPQNKLAGTSGKTGVYYLEDITDSAKESDKKAQPLNVTQVSSTEELIQHIAEAIMKNHESLKGVNTHVLERTYTSSSLPSSCLQNAMKEFPDLVAAYENPNDFCAWDSYYWVARLTLTAILLEISGTVILKTNSIGILFQIAKGTQKWLTPIVNMIIRTTGVCFKMLQAQEYPQFAYASALCTAMTGSMVTIFKTDVQGILQEAMKHFKSKTEDVRGVIQYIASAFSKLSALKFAHHLRVLFRSKKLFKHGLKIIPPEEIKSITNSLDNALQEMLSCKGLKMAPCKATDGCKWTVGKPRGQGCSSATQAGGGTKSNAKAPSSTSGRFDRSTYKELQELCKKHRIGNCNAKREDLVRRLLAQT